MIKQKLTARDLMTADVRTIAADAPLAEAIAMMDSEGFSQLPVMVGSQPVGLLTEADVRQALVAARDDRPVRELASPLPEVMDPGDRVSRVLAALRRQEALLVVESDQLRGIITYWDALVLSQPFVMVTEVELILRRVVSALCEQKYGPDWWDKLPASLRQKAEEEHHDNEPPTPDHMLGHTSFYGLNAIFRYIYPNITDKQTHLLDRIRVLRNEVAHHYLLTDAERQELTACGLEAGDWLETLLPADQPLEAPPAAQ